MTNQLSAAPARAGTAPSSRLPADFMTMLAHDLRQPLSTIESTAFYLRMVLGRQDPNLVVHLDRIRMMVEQLNSMIADTVQLLCRPEPRPQSLDLNEIVSQTLAGHGEPETPLRIDLCHQPAVVHVDPSMAALCVRGLLHALEELARPASALGLRTEVGAEVRLVLAAAGRGLTAERMAMLDDTFHPALPAGVGLALASARDVVSSHGGRLEIEPGNGELRLVVRFPAGA